MGNTYKPAFSAAHQHPKCPWLFQRGLCPKETPAPVALHGKIVIPYLWVPLRVIKDRRQSTFQRIGKSPAARLGATPPLLPLPDFLAWR
jgi:hypothetical protein